MKVGARQVTHTSDCGRPGSRNCRVPVYRGESSDDFPLAVTVKEYRLHEAKSFIFLKESRNLNF